MKLNRFFQLALAGMLLAVTGACQDKEVLIDTEFNQVELKQPDKDRVIDFATFTNRSVGSRAVATVSDLEFYHNTFKVYGTKTSNDGQKIQPVFEGVVVSANISAHPDSANTWTYSPDRYWDKQADHYQFIAFAPAHAALGYQHNLVEVNDSTATFFSTSDYKLIGQNLQEGAPSAAEKNCGFSGATDSLGNILSDCDVMRSDPFAVLDPATTPVVTLNFRHTLAKLLVSIKANAAKPYIITINSVSVEHLLSTGDYHHNDGWQAKGSDEVSYHYTTPDTAITSTQKTYFIESLVMPQAVDSAQMLSINYTVTTGSYSEDFSYAINMADIFGSKAGSFVAGNSYTANFTIAPEKNIITFEAGITAWTENSSNPHID